MRAPCLCAMMFVFGCGQITSQRCQRIAYAQRVYERYAYQETKFLQHLHAVADDTAAQRFHHRAVRAQAATRFRVLMDSVYATWGDTGANKFSALDPSTPAKDSADPPLVPPPPSGDSAWFAAHCPR